MSAQTIPLATPMVEDSIVNAPNAPLAKVPPQNKGYFHIVEKITMQSRLLVPMVAYMPVCVS